ncbi:MAG: M48 family metallopeptidase [Acidiferrobacteraceae bacterium]
MRRIPCDPVAREERGLEYELLRRRRRSLCIQVREDGSVRVLAPQGASEHEIRKLVIERRLWIDRKRAEQHNRPPGVSVLPVHGASLPFLDCRLVLELAGGRGPAERIGHRLRVPGSDAKTALRALKTWYRNQAREKALCEHAPWSARIGRHPRDFVIREQKTRWGSCSAQGIISLNWRLMLGAPTLFEYVLVHELCHLRHLHHGPQFWTEIARLLPDHADRRRALRSFSGTWFDATAPAPCEQISG